MFNFEREFLGENSMSECQMAERSLEQRQRDVYETHRHRTFAVAFYMTGNEIEAAEVLEDTFVRAFQVTEEPDGRGVDHAMVDELRERVPLDQPAEPATASSRDALSSRNVKRTELEEALKELPANERIVFLLRDVEGYSSERVAELLKLPRLQIERTTISARIRLRQALSRAQAQPAAA